MLAPHGIELVAAPVEERLSEQELIPLLRGISGVICGDDAFTARVLASAPDLEVISKWGTGIDSIGDQKVVRDLQKRWSGILLFRDGFRVLPYGEDADDWLALDRRAMGSSGYLLNKTQFVGRIDLR